MDRGTCLGAEEGDVGGDAGPGGEGPALRAHREHQRLPADRHLRPAMKQASEMHTCSSRSDCSTFLICATTTGGHPILSFPTILISPEPQAHLGLK